MESIKKTLSKLSSSSGFKRYLGNTLWLFSEKILRIVISVFVAIWMARHLGSEQYGLFNYVLSIIGLLTAIATLGLDNVVVKELVKNNFSESTILGTSLALKLTAGFVIYGALLFICLALENEQTQSLLLILGGLNILKSITVIDFFFQSKVKSKYVVKATFFALIFSNGLKIYFIVGDLDLEAFGWAVLSEHIVLAFGLIYFYRATGNSFKTWRFDTSCARCLMLSAWPLVLTAFAASLYMKIDQVMVGQMLGHTEVGLYAAAVRLSEALYFIPVVITASVFPALVETKKRNQVLYLKRLENLYRLVVYLALTFAFPLSFLASWIVNTLYGAEYTSSGDVFRIHVWSSVFVFMNAAFAKFLYVESYERKYLYRTLLGATLNIVLNYLWIPKYGIEGAAYASLVSMALMNYIYDIFDKDLRPFLILKLRCFLPIPSIGN